MLRSIARTMVGCRSRRQGFAGTRLLGTVDPQMSLLDTDRLLEGLVDPDSSYGKLAVHGRSLICDGGFVQQPRQKGLVALSEWSGRAERRVPTVKVPRAAGRSCLRMDSAVTVNGELRR
jgi:hypothetical protein